MIDVGGENVQFIEIDQPFCARTYGTSPCVASIGVTGAYKCYQTRKVCQDTANYLAVLKTLRFALGHEGIEKLYDCIPSIIDVDVAPGSVNLAGMENGQSPLGRREVLTVNFKNHRHADVGLDKYRTERNHDDSIAKHLESVNWRPGVTPTDYSLNESTAGESVFGYRTGPFGDEEVVNVCINKDTFAGEPGADGGWGTSETIPIDNTKGYLFALWMKRKTAGGSSYWGLSSNGSSEVLDVPGGASNNNPYFESGGSTAILPNADQWYLVVGYVHPNAYAGSDLAISGVYTTAGTKVVDGLEFKWASGTTFAGHRSYHYYNTSDPVDTEVQQMTQPRVFQCDSGNATALIKRLLAKPYKPDQQGTMWGKWLARNPFHPGYAMRVYWGKVGQPLVQNMVPRSGDLMNAAWTANAHISRSADGIWTHLNDTSGTDFGTLFSGNMPTTAGRPYNFSFKVRKETSLTQFGLIRAHFKLGNGTVVQYFGVKFNANTGEILKDDNAGSIISCYDEGDAWRFVVAAIAPATSVQVDFGIYPAAGTLPLSGSYSSSVTGSLRVSHAQASPGLAPGMYTETFAAASAAGMKVRSYVIDRIDGPTNGKVTLTAKDIFSKLEERKAVCPKASRGELFADITSGATSLQLFPTGIGSEYLSSGYVAIGDEIIQYSSKSGDVLNGLTRGALNTVADAHKDEDLVQQVKVFTSMQAHDIIYELMTSFADVPAHMIDLAAWDIAASTMIELYTARIATPEPVVDLIGELCEQAGCSVVPNMTTGMIEFSALRSANPIITLTDEQIKYGSLKPKKLDSKRVSQVWIYYGQINPIEDLDEKRNYHSRYATIDLDAENDVEYGVASIKEMFSRWIPQFGRTVAEVSATRVKNLFRDPPYELAFKTDLGSVTDLRLANTIGVKSGRIETPTGEVATIVGAIVEQDIEDNGASMGMKLMETNFGPEVTDKTIYVENNTLDFNFRAVWESIFGVPQSGVTAKCVVESGVFVGSSSTSTAAFDSGDWPAGVTLQIENKGRIQGKGGAGGTGGSSTANATFITASANNGSPGGAGGTALKIRYACTVTNTNGSLQGGGGGGGGGGGAAVAVTGDGLNTCAAAGGTGGSGGRGNTGTGGGGGAGGSVSGGGVSANGNNGNSSTTESPGSAVGGVQAQSITGGPTATANSGAGGAGGASGTAGSTGATGSSSFAGEAGPVQQSHGTGGAGGAAGNAVDGNSFITWNGTGERLGPIV